MLKNLILSGLWGGDLSAAVWLQLVAELGITSRPANLEMGNPARNALLLILQWGGEKSSRFCAGLLGYDWSLCWLQWAEHPMGRWGIQQGIPCSVGCLPLAAGLGAAGQWEAGESSRRGSGSRDREGCRWAPEKGERKKEGAGVGAARRRLLGGARVHATQIRALGAPPPLGSPPARLRAAAGQGSSAAPPAAAGPPPPCV